MTRNICITSADGQTGHLTAELLLTYDQFSSKIDSVLCLAMDPSKCADLKQEGAKVLPMDISQPKHLVTELKKAKVDTIFLIPPAHKDKVEMVKACVGVAKQAGVQNVLFLSSAGADLAGDKQPRLREFIDMEAMVMEQKGTPDAPLAHSPCILRAGFYAENLLLYNKEAQAQGKLPLPIGMNHKFAPVALGDIALLAATVLVSQGPHGFADNIRGQLLVMTGPMLASGKELATAASEGGSTNLEFENISDKQAIAILSEEPELDDSEKEYLLQYYSLVKEGKTNYVSTIAFHALVGQAPEEPSGFFKVYASEFRKKKRRTH